MVTKPIFREQQIYAARHNVLRWSMYQPDGKTPVGIAAEDEFQAPWEVRFEALSVASSARVPVDGEHAAARSFQ